MINKRLGVFFTTLLVFAAGQLSAAITDDCQRNVMPEELDTSIEVELRAVHKGTTHFTSESKKIFSLMTLDERPEFEAASFDQQLQEIQRLVRSGEVDFNLRRRIPGLRMKTKVPLKWARPVKFLGKDYSSGVEHLADISGLLKANFVEIGDAESLQDPALFEFHFRSSLYAPSELQNQIFTLLEGLGLSKDKLHAHVVGPLNKDQIKRASKRFAVINAIRYVNLAAEMITILEKNLSIQTSSPSDWNSLEDSRLTLLELCLKAWTHHSNPCGRDDFKMAYVGWHFPEKYDGEGNFGFHFRSLDRARRKSFGPFMDSAQDLFKNDINDANESAWLSKHELVVGKLWYRSAAGGIDLNKASREVFEKLKSHPHLYAILDTAAKFKFEAAMLTYDWSRDPIFFAQPEKQKQVIDCQAKALNQVRQLGSYSLTQVKEFLRCSGLLESVQARLWDMTRR